MASFRLALSRLILLYHLNKIMSQTNTFEVGIRKYPTELYIRTKPFPPATDSYTDSHPRYTFNVALCEPATEPNTMTLKSELIEEE